MPDKDNGMVSFLTITPNKGMVFVDIHGENWRWAWLSL